MPLLKKGPGGRVIRQVVPVDVQQRVLSPVAPYVTVPASNTVLPSTLKPLFAPSAKLQWGVVVGRTQSGWLVDYGGGDSRSVTLVEVEVTLVQAVAMASFLTATKSRGTSPRTTRCRGMWSSLGIVFCYFLMSAIVLVGSACIVWCIFVHVVVCFIESNLSLSFLQTRPSYKRSWTVGCLRTLRRCLTVAALT